MNELASWSVVDTSLFFFYFNRDREIERQRKSRLRKKWNSDENVVLLHPLKEKRLTYP